MNSFRLGVFDIFGYIIPGIAYIILISIGVNLTTYQEVINKISSLSLYSLLAYFFIAYLVGFGLEMIAKKFCSYIIEFKKGKIENMILEKFNNKNPDDKIEYYNNEYFYTFADIYSPISREKSDTFSALALMSRNLSFAFFLFIILTIIYNVIHTDQITWLIFSLKIIFGLLISFVFLYQAYCFKRNSLEHLLYTYHIISKNADKIESPKKPKDRKS